MASALPFLTRMWVKKKVDDKREKGKEKTPEAWTLLTTQQVVCVCSLPMFLTLEISEQL